MAGWLHGRRLAGAVVLSWGVAGSRLTFRSPNDQSHFVHVGDAGESVWVPLMEAERNVVGVDGAVGALESGSRVIEHSFDSCECLF